MRRHNVLLLAQARHDPAAKCEAGRRYLVGAEGLPRHVSTGLEYLTHHSLKADATAAVIIGESLTLPEIVLHQQESTMLRAAQAGSAPAQFKLAFWTCLRHGQPKAAARWLDTAAAAGHAAAQVARQSLGRPTNDGGVLAMARSANARGDIEVVEVATLAAQRLSEENDLFRLALCLRVALDVAPAVTADLANLVTRAVKLAELSGTVPPGLEARHIEASLELRVADDDRDAEFLMGRALCGIACGSIEPTSLVTASNLRKGAAYLLRAADAGCDAAWMHLYQVHSDHRCSVANPQMARFFLEKAAALGQAQAQRRLGALILRSANCLKDSESGIRWLHQAAAQGDTLAMRLLRSLVLPLRGDDEQAEQAIESVRRTDPWLAVRLRLSRDFGLTKLEALCANPADGQRPWGFVVGKNDFIAQSRLSAPRAVPAVTPAALAGLHRAALFFEQAQRDGSLFEGDWRRRSLHQRRAFARLHLDEDLFFARVNSTTLDTLRQGTKWAVRAKQSLQQALAA